MIYKIRLVWLNNSGEVCRAGKRMEQFITPQELRVGGLYFLRPGKLYRVERLEAAEE